jgi:hypothetical protein
MTTNPNPEMLLPLEVVAELAAAARERRNCGTHLKDVTLEYIGKASLIFTGQKPPKKQ